MEIIIAILVIATWLSLGLVGYKLYCRKMSVEGCEPYTEPENRNLAIASGPIILLWLYWPL